MSEETPESGVGTEAPRSAGGRLRAAREAQGLRVETAAEALGFAPGIILALEADDYARLGAPVYVRGYLRKYARYLGLAEDELVAHYERGAAPREPELKARLSPLAAPRHGGGRRWLLGVVAIVVIAILVIAGLWAWRFVRQARQTTQIPPAAAASAAPAFSKTRMPAGFAALPPKATRAVAGAAASTPGAASAAVAAKASAGVASATVAASEPQLVLHLTAVSWIEVRAADQTRLYYDLAPAGKTLSFNGRHGALTVYLGNAAAVKVQVNGHPYAIPAASRKGDTARFQVDLTPADASAAASAQ